MGSLWVSDPIISRMISVIKFISLTVHEQSMLLREIWDLFNLGQFDPINPMIPLSGAHCNESFLMAKMMHN